MEDVGGGEGEGRIVWHRLTINSRAKMVQTAKSKRSFMIAVSVRGG
jgi:hypothetical protein